MSTLDELREETRVIDGTNDDGMYEEAGEHFVDQARTLKTEFAAEKRAATEYDELLAPKREELDRKIAELRSAFEIENAEALNNLAEHQTAADTREAELRALAIDHFNKTGNKTLDENLSVRVNVRLDYENDDAVEWAEKNAPILIYRTIDKKQFEATAKIHKPDFVRFEETPSAVIKGL